MSEREYAALKESIALNGQTQAVLFFEGKILDGFHRYKACDELGIAPERQEFSGTVEQARLLVLTQNLCRRDVSKSQKAIVLALASQIPAPAGEGHFRVRGTGRRTIDQLGRQYGLSHVLLYHAAHLRASSLELTEKVLNGTFTVAKAIQILNLGKACPELARAVLEGNLTLREARLLAWPRPPAQEGGSPESAQRERELALVRLASKDPESAKLVAQGGLPIPHSRLSGRSEMPAEEVGPPSAIQRTECELGYHPLNTFPRMTPAEHEALVLSIRAVGLLNPITLFEGLVLDGRERFQACMEAGVAPVFEIFNGTSEEALQFVISKNLIRDHFNVSQRAVIAITTEPEQVKAGNSRRRLSSLSRRSGVNRVSLYKAGAIVEGRPDLVPQIRDGKFCLTAAEKQLGSS